MTSDDTTRHLPSLDPTSGPTVGPAFDPTSHEAAAAEPGATAVVPYDPAPPVRRGPRMRTLVLGLVLLAVSGTTSLRLLTHVHVDDGIVLLVLLLVAGALLLGGGILGAAREAGIRRD